LPKSGWERGPVHSRPHQDRKEDKRSIWKRQVQIAYAFIGMEQLRLTTVRHQFSLLAWAGLPRHLHLHLAAVAAVVVFQIASVVHSHSVSKFKLLDRVFERGR
jgi:hypothetical protein